MAILNPNETFFTAFEPKQQNRFVMYIDGFPTYMVKGVGAISLTQGVVTLNHINVQRKVKGKTVWNDVSLQLFDPVDPSGAQAVMEWIRLGHESVTGRDGYSDFYKKDLTFSPVGPTADIVSEWVLKGAFPIESNFGDYNYDNVDTAQEISLTLAIDYAVLNF